MILKQKISNIIGPSGIFAGYILFFGGMVATYYSLSGIPLVILGAVFAFTSTRSYLDLGSKRYKVVLFLCGVFPIGKWEEMDPEDLVSVRHSRGVYTSFSMSNRRSSVGRDDFLVILQRGTDRKKITLACFKTKKEADELASRLQILLTGD